MESNEQTLAAKMAKLGQLHQAVTVAKRDVVKGKSPEAALALQALQTQVASLRATLPPLRLVATPRNALLGPCA